MVGIWLGYVLAASLGTNVGTKKGLIVELLVGMWKGVNVGKLLG